MSISGVVARTLQAPRLTGPAGAAMKDAERFNASIETLERGVAKQVLADGNVPLEHASHGQLRDYAADVSDVIDDDAYFILDDAYRASSTASEALGDAAMGRWRNDVLGDVTALRREGDRLFHAKVPDVAHGMAEIGMATARLRSAGEDLATMLSDEARRTAVNRASVAVAALGGGGIGAVATYGAVISGD